jgi:prevent-host-death family protein
MNFHEKPNKKLFSTADLARKTSDVLHAASQRPVVITQRNKPRFVMMSLETFDRLNPQKAYGTQEVPDEVAAWLLPALDKIAEGDFGDDE